MILVFAFVLLALRIFYSVGEMIFERDWPRHTWRGLFIALALFLMCCSAFGQAARYDWNVQTINSSAPQPGGEYPVLSIPGATVNICNAPATGFTVISTGVISNGCTNLATTYTDATMGTPCSTSTQFTRAGSTTCVGYADSQGGFGLWIAGGTYQYTVTTPAGSYGPYDFTAGNGGTLASVTSAQGTAPIQVNGDSGTPHTGAVTVSCPECAQSGLNFGNYLTPPTLTQGAWIYPTAFTPISSSYTCSPYGASVPPSVALGTFGGSLAATAGPCGNNPNPDIAGATFTFAGALEAAGINPANVTAMWAGVTFSVSQTGVSTSVALSCNANSPANNWLNQNVPLQQTTFSITGTNADAVSCTITANHAFGNGTGTMNLNMPVLAVFVTYTGTPVVAPPQTAFQSPLNFNAGTSTVNLNLPYDLAWDTGIADVYAAAVPAYITIGQTAISGVGSSVYLYPAHTNISGTPTFNMNASGAMTIVKAGGTLTSGDIVAGKIAHLVSNGTNWQLLNPQTGVAAALSGVPTGAAGGSVNAWTVTTTPYFSSLAAGQMVLWLPTGQNTSATPTLNVNGTGAITIVKSGNTALYTSGDLSGGEWALVTYNGTNWILQNPYKANSFFFRNVTGGMSIGSTLQPSNSNTIVGVVTSSGLSDTTVGNLATSSGTSVAVGYLAHAGGHDVMIGAAAGSNFTPTASNFNTCVGYNCFNGISQAGTPTHNIAIGDSAGSSGNNFTNSGYIGSSSYTSANGTTNQWLFGYNIQSGKSNYQQFGNTSITDTQINGIIERPVGTAIASATTIAPTQPMFHVTGTTAIQTITAPSACTTTGYACQLTIIPDGLWTTIIGGNIALATTAVVSKTLTMTYDPATSLWYPSY